MKLSAASRRLILALGACAVSCAWTSTTSAQADTNVFGSLSNAPIFSQACGNPYALTHEQRESCGEHSYPLTQVDSGAYGGTRYRYDLGDDTAVTVIIP